MTMWRYVPEHYGKIFKSIKNENPKEALPPNSLDIGFHEWIRTDAPKATKPGNVHWNGSYCYSIQKAAEKHNRPISDSDHIYIFEIGQYKFTSPLAKTLSTEYLKGFYTFQGEPKYAWFVKKWLEVVDEIEPQQTMNELKKSLREKLIASWKC